MQNQFYDFAIMALRFLQKKVLKNISLMWMECLESINFFHHQTEAFHEN